MASLPSRPAIGSRRHNGRQPNTKNANVIVPETTPGRARCVPEQTRRSSGKEKGHATACPSSIQRRERRPGAARRRRNRSTAIPLHVLQHLGLHAVHPCEVLLQARPAPPPPAPRERGIQLEPLVPRATGAASGCWSARSSATAATRRGRRRYWQARVGQRVMQLLHVGASPSSRAAVDCATAVVPHALLQRVEIELRLESGEHVLDVHPRAGPRAMAMAERGLRQRDAADGQEQSGGGDCGEACMVVFIVDSLSRVSCRVIAVVAQRSGCRALRCFESHCPRAVLPAGHLDCNRVIARGPAPLQSLTVRCSRRTVAAVLMHGTMADQARTFEDPRRRRRRAPARPPDPLSRRAGLRRSPRSPDARDIDKKLQRDPPHLLVLDLMLPGEDGLSVCRRLRGAGETVPIIMLTAKGEDVDRIVGLEMGADDYLPKPFNPRELVARIHAVLRRHGERIAPGAPGEEGSVPFGPLRARPLRAGAACATARASRSPPASSRCSRSSCSIRASRSRARS